MGATRYIGQQGYAKLKVNIKFCLNFVQLCNYCNCNRNIQEVFLQIPLDRSGPTVQR